MAFSLTSLLLLLAASCSATKYPVQQYSWYKDYDVQPLDYCLYACFSCVGSITFNVTPVGGPEDYTLNECANPLLVKSLFYCGQKYCSLKESEHGRNYLAKQCEGTGYPLPSVETYLLPGDELAQVQTVNETAALETADAPLSQPAIPDPEWMRLYELTLKDFYTSWDLGWDFSFGLIAFWGFVVFVGMIHRLLVLATKPSESRHFGWWLWIRRNLILPATFGKHQAEAVRSSYTIPPRWETIILTVYALMNFIMCFLGYHSFVGNQYYATKKLQLARYISDRTGFLSFAQLPMVWLFAARNDPLMWLTGWSFATYNRFHRWIARISVVHAVVHSIGWSVYDLYAPQESPYDASWAELYWQAGGVGTVVMAFMLLFSAYYFRANFYDLFLVVHIVLSVVFVAMMWYHVQIFNGEFNYFLYPPMAIWALDRLLRYGRMAYVSALPRFLKGVKATATYHRDTEMIRLDVTDFFPESSGVVPGRFYYLYMPAGLRGYESHPFTLCSWRRSRHSRPAASPPAAISDDKAAHARARSLSSSSDTAHTLLIRPYKGMTGRLQHQLLATAPSNATASTQTTVFLEGPYGAKLDLSAYSDVLVICGGSGITAAISHAHFLVGKPRCSTNVHIVWAVHHRHLPDDVCGTELASVIHTPRVDMTVYLTGAAAAEQKHEDAHASLSKHPAAAAADPPYEVRLGRPDVEEVLREQRKSCARNLAVVTCGTPQMADACRGAVVKILGNGGEGKGVEWFNETLVW